MSNLHFFRITVKGEGRDAIRQLFTDSTVTTDYGCVWDLRHRGDLLRCDLERGDGISINLDSIEIRGESDGSLPLTLIQALSEEYPSLIIEIAGTDLTNLHSQRWLFEEGVSRLMDCVEEADTNNPEVAYVLEGQQYLPLPQWIAALDAYVPNDEGDDELQ